MPWVISSDGKEIQYKKVHIHFLGSALLFFEIECVQWWLFFFVRLLSGYQFKMQDGVGFFNLEKFKHILRSLNQSFIWRVAARHKRSSWRAENFLFQKGRENMRQTAGEVNLSSVTSWPYQLWEIISTACWFFLIYFFFKPEHVVLFYNEIHKTEVMNTLSLSGCFDARLGWL